MNGTPSFKVAMSIDFLTAYDRIPKNVRKRVTDFINKFRANPELPGINLEPIQQAMDRNMYSVRIDQDYRGVVHRPAGENVYLLLWVDKHDDAYGWATRKRCAVNAFTGSLQIYNVEETSLPVEPPEKAGPPESGFRPEEISAALFSSISREQLLRMGVPDESVDWVRGLSNIEELEADHDRLPQESFEALQFIAAGMSIDEVIRELFEDEGIGPADDTSFGRALGNPGTLQQFMILDAENEKELQDMLNAPLEKWRVFLHRSQRKLVERNFNGPVRVLGGAGTGKTVVAMHRARWLAKTAFPDAMDRILVTTFTVNLAEDIRNNLRDICDAETMRRIEVVHIDKWVKDFLNSRGYDFDVLYGKELEECWERAIALSRTDLPFDVNFYLEEWERVIAGNDVHTLDDYVRVSRASRGARLSRADRKRVWQVAEAYQKVLNEERSRDIQSMLMAARVVLRKNPDLRPYRAVIVDEAQDMSPQVFRLLRDLIGEEQRNDIFVVGDAHQRIYARRASLGSCGINIRGRSRILKINYRTTEETRNWAFRILKNEEIDDLDGGVEDGKGYLSLFKGVKPEIRHFLSQEEEIDYLHRTLTELIENGIDIRDICLVARTSRILKDYKTGLQRKGWDTYEIKATEAEKRDRDCVRVATMHRVKGLEFEVMFIVSACAGVIPQEYLYRNEQDAVRKRELELAERSLFYVAATRPKTRLYVTSFGAPSPFLNT